MARWWDKPPGVEYRLWLAGQGTFDSSMEDAAKIVKEQETGQILRAGEGRTCEVGRQGCPSLELLFRTNSKASVNTQARRQVSLANLSSSLAFLHPSTTLPAGCSCGCL